MIDLSFSALPLCGSLVVGGYTTMLSCGKTWRGSDAAISLTDENVYKYIKTKSQCGHCECKKIGV